MGHTPSWPYQHAARGTCVPGCPRYGRCHCGCDVRPRISPANLRTAERVKDRPHVFAAGHHVRIFPRNAGCHSTTGIDVRRIRPLLFWLRDRYGSMRKVSEVLELPESTVRGYAYKQQLLRVPASSAEVIVRLVLRYRRNGADPLDRWIEEWPFQDQRRSASGQG